MKRVAKPIFFIVAVLILAFTTLSITGISTKYGDIETVIIKGVDDIRWGIDIRGGVDVTFTAPDDIDPTDAQLNAAAEVMKQRLISLGVTDYDVYTDPATDRIIVRYPWKEDETEFDAQDAIKELGDTAVLSFRAGVETDETGKPSGETADILIEGSNVKEAKAMYQQATTGSEAGWVVSLEFDSTGAKLFSESTGKLVNKQMSIWMDDQMISAPVVNEQITDGNAIISGGNPAFTMESAQELANKINGGALPFDLVTEDYSAISPILGEGARNAMVLSGIIAFILICIYVSFLYKLPGMIACICLLGQVGGTLAALTGFFPGMASFTLTIPGIAGMILAVGVGVDANIITAERIKEEIKSGKSIDGSIELGYKRAFTAILDGNLTVVIVAIILMGTFGPSDSLFSTIMRPILFFFPEATEGTIYSFGYTLLVGVILNFVFGIFASKYMVKSISRFKFFRKAKFYGGDK